jgi:diaminopimelate epimerase
MSYYNRDGSFGAMCGNGARCTAQYTVNNNILKEKSFRLEAVDKVYSVDMISENVVRVGFPPVTEYKLNSHIELGKELTLLKLHWMNVGSEHIVVFIGDIINPKVSKVDEVQVNEWGKSAEIS